MVPQSLSYPPPRSAKHHGRHRSGPSPRRSRARWASSAPFNSLCLRALTIEVRHRPNRSRAIGRLPSAAVTSQKMALPLSLQLNEPESSMKSCIAGILRCNHGQSDILTRTQRIAQLAFPFSGQEHTNVYSSLFFSFKGVNITRECFESPPPRRQNLGPHQMISIGIGRPKLVQV